MKNKDFFGNLRFVVIDFWKEIVDEVVSINVFECVKFLFIYGFMYFLFCERKKLEFYYI